MEDDLFPMVLSELKSLGVKIPKLKKLKSIVSKQNSQERTCKRTNNKIFGVNLSDQEWILEDGIALPKFVSSSTRYLRQCASNEIGLFRKAGSVARQKELRLKLENGESLEASEPNDIASLLKQWLRELPEPLVPVYLHELFTRCQNIDDEDKRITAVLLSCLLLPAEHLQTLKHLLIFLANIAANSDKNKMGFNNLAVIMAPNIFVIGSEAIDKSSNNTVQLHASLMQLLIENAEKVGVIPNAQGTQICNQIESELSSDALDFSPKSKKKRRSGKVQDIFSGIRKLVGQNSTPVVSKKETPDKSQSKRTSVSRSASKRKAEGDQESMSSVKKQAISRNEGKNGAVKPTPERKIDVNTPANSEKSCRAHSRKKSFGLLRRKERRKKSHDTEDMTVDSGEKSTMYVEKNSRTQEIKVAEITPEEIEMSPLLSQSDIERIIAGSSSFKNSMFNHLLEVPNEELKRISAMPSGSPYKNSPKKHSLSPYYLRSNKVSEGSISGEINPLEIKSISAEKKISHNQKSLLAERDHINISFLSDSHSEKVNTHMRDFSFLSADNLNFGFTPRKQRSNRKYDDESSFSKAICQIDNKNSDACAFKNISESQFSEKKLKRSTSQIKQNSTITFEEDFSIENGLKQNTSKCLNAIESDSENFVPNSSPRKGLKRNASKCANITPITLEKLAPISAKQYELKQKNSTLSEFVSENLAPISSSKQGLRRNSSKNLKTAVPTSETLAPISYPRNEVKRNSSRVSNKTTSTSKTINVRKSSIKRQEAFIVKRVKSITGKNAVTQVKSLENNVKTQFAPTQVSFKGEARSNVTSEANGIKRNSSRKGSIVRGRPNTVKTGLPTDLNIRLSNESMLSSGAKVNYHARISPGSDVSLEFNTENSSLKVNIAPKLNISQNNETECFPFSPNISSNIFLIDNSFITPNAKISDSIFKDEDSDMNLDMNMNQNSIKSKISKKSRLRMSSNSDSKIHRHKNSLKVSRTNSFPNPVKNNSEMSSISEALNNVLAIDNIKENIDSSAKSELTVSDNNENKETRKNVDMLEENSDVWVSGRNFLDKLQPEEEVFNKRESIAMILRNKPGHVQAKVSLYDRQTRNPTHSTPNASNISTPLNVCHRTYSLRNELPRQICIQSANKSFKRNVSENQALQISNGCNSTPRFKNKTRSKIALPPPPKFNDCNSSFATPIASYPLKELTNMNSQLESSLSNSSNKIDCITPVKNQDEDLFLTPEVFPSPIKPKRKSFSGYTPHKISKVSRSESSPVIFKKRNKQSLHKSSSVTNTSNDQKLSSDQDQLLVFETGSALSFEKLKLDQMLDEWQYEM